MSVKKNYDLKVSLLRFIAMLFIVICHFFQYNGYFLAWWFNVGVQIFLFLSGYLYGKKVKIDGIYFIRKNFYKIFLDFFCYISLIYLILLFVSADLNIPFSLYLKQILCIDYLPGLAHLWYIPCILVCYFLTPLFHEVDRYLKSNESFYLLKLVIFLFIMQIIGLYYTKNINSVWIICYAFGFYFSRYIIPNNKENIFYIISIILCFILNILITSDFGLSLLKLINIQQDSLWYSLINNYGHIFLAISIFALINKFIPTSLISHKILLKILSISDMYSYDVYLVHQFYILGPIAFLSITKNIFLNYLIVLVLIILSAFFLKVISCYINKLISRRRLS